MEGMEQSGLARLTANMLDESTQNYTTEQMADELDKLGSTIQIYSGRENVGITVTSLTKNLDATLKLLEEKLFKPKFDKKDFKVQKDIMLSRISSQYNYASAIAGNVYASLVYGKESIFSVSVWGTKQTVSKLTVDDVKAFYAKYYAPDFAQMVIVGDISKEAVLSKMPFLNTWTKKGNIALPSIPTATNPEKTKIYLVNKNNAPQSEIRIGNMSLPNNPVGEMYKAGIMIFPFGGHFGSRINTKLREVKGWTYGTYAWFGGSAYNGPFTMGGGFKGAVTDSAVYEFMTDIKAYADEGMTAEELEFTKNSLGQEEALKYETQGAKAIFLSQMLEYNLPDDYVDKQAAILTNITNTDVLALAKKYLTYNNMYIVIVGDKSKVKEPLSRLGYEIVELDMDGKPVM